MDKDYKYKFLIMKTEVNMPKTLLRNMIDEYIKKLRADIEMYSGPNALVNEMRIKKAEEEMVEVINWRKTVDLIGSDEVYDMGSLEFKDRFKRIYSEK